jgi:hypothetical protein
LASAKKVPDSPPGHTEQAGRLSLCHELTLNHGLPHGDSLVDRDYRSLPLIGKQGPKKYLECPLLVREEVHATDDLLLLAAARRGWGSTAPQELC